MADEVLPQITLTGAGAELNPEQVLAHALKAYQAGVRAEAEAAMLAGPTDLSADVLSSILMEIASGHLTPFRFAAGVAFRTTIKQAHRRNLQAISEMEAAQDADEAALNLGSYLGATSSNAVMDGYHLNVNAKVPRKEAARRAVHAFGLTTPQMRTAFKIKDDGVASSEPGAWKNLVDRFIERAFGQRIATIIGSSLHQVAEDAVQRGWERDIADGTLSETAQKMWNTALDERTCPVCAPMDGVVVGVMEKFRLPDGNKVKTPPVHPLCRCAATLVPEEISKAYDPHEVRDARGRWTKTKTRDEQLAVVDNLLASAGLGSASLNQGRLTQGKLSSASLDSTSLASGSLSSQSLHSASTQAATSQPLNVISARTHALLGTSNVKLSTLGADLATQSAVRLTDDLRARQKMAGAAWALPPAEELYPMDRNMVSYTTGAQLKTQSYSGNEDSGFAQIDIPIRFVDRGNAKAVSAQIEKAMHGLDRYFREEDGIKASLSEVQKANDPGIGELGAQLNTQVQARTKKIQGSITVSVSPEDASLAWRYLLAERGSRYPARYTVEAYDATGTTVARAEVSAGTIAAMTGIDPKHPELPRVVIAPHGTWKSGSGHGETGSAHDNPNHLLVTGPFAYHTEREVLVLVPDPGVYRRANPEN